MMQQGSGIRGPSTITPGGTIEAEVDGGTGVSVTIDGQPPQKLPVNGGKVSVPVPANLPSGTLIQIVVLGRVPPAGITVEVIDTK